LTAQPYGAQTSFMQLSPGSQSVSSEQPVSPGPQGQVFPQPSAAPHAFPSHVHSPHVPFVQTRSGAQTPQVAPDPPQIPEEQWTPSAQSASLLHAPPGGCVPQASWQFVQAP
jgi:hypothetical protein